MVAKIKAACDARRDHDFVIITRTDAIAIEGLDAALERGVRYREAGADMLFIEAPVGRAEVDRVSQHFKGVPLLYNMAASGKTPDLPADELGKLGFRLAIYPNWVILAAIPAMQDLLSSSSAPDQSRTCATKSRPSSSSRRLPACPRSSNSRSVTACLKTSAQVYNAPDSINLAPTRRRSAAPRRRYSLLHPRIEKTPSAATSDGRIGRPLGWRTSTSALIASSRV
jgi:hypothetical protein